jgi:1-acyl-sn-glycerol-3-phosphate acyltransferase
VSRAGTVGPGQAVTTVRRAVVVPLVLAAEATLLAAAPLLLAVAAVCSLTSPRRVPLRATALVVAYAAIELRGCAELLALHRAGRADDVDACYALVARFLDRLAGAVARTIGVRVRLTPDSARGDEAGATAPLVVLSRHAGPGDSFLLARLLLCGWGLRPRIVLRRALRLEPGIDLLLSRLPSCFVRRGGGATTKAAIAGLAGSMGEGDALLIFPEGGNFSEERRRERIARLLRRRAYADARRARAMRHVLAPYPGGALAALEAAPHADVLVVAHSGLAPRGARERRWWSLPVHQDLVVCAWRVHHADLPAGREARERWLFDQWRRIDDWVAEHRADRPPRRGPVARLRASRAGRSAASAASGRAGGRSRSRPAGRRRGR